MGLAVSTVSRALSGNGRVSESTRQSIQEYLKNKKLVPNARNRKYTDIKTNVIGITVPMEEEFFYMPYFQVLFSSIYDYFSAVGYQVIPIKTKSDDVSNLEQAIRHHAMDGVILSRQVENDDEIRLLEKHRVPFIVIGKAAPSDIPQVETDTEAASFDLMNGLIGNGYRKIAVMGDQQNHPINQKRLNGIKKACVQNYLVLNREFIFWETESAPIMEAAIEKILDGQMECMLCMDDNICLKSLLMLQRLGKQVPQDIKVASLHDSDLLGKWNPSITCVHYDTHLFGREAGELLYRCLTGQERIPNVKLGYEIRWKEST